MRLSHQFSLRSLHINTVVCACVHAVECVFDLTSRSLSMNKRSFVWFGCNNRCTVPGSKEGSGQAPVSGKVVHPQNALTRVLWKMAPPIPNQARLRPPFTWTSVLGLCNMFVLFNGFICSLVGWIDRRALLQCLRPILWSFCPR